MEGTRVIATLETSEHEARTIAFDTALARLPLVFAAEDVLAWIHDNAGWVEDAWVGSRIIADTVNDRRRQHFPGSRDRLYRRADGRFERYDPAVHGLWSKAGRPAEARSAPMGVSPSGSPWLDR